MRTQSPHALTDLLLNALEQERNALVSGDLDLLQTASSAKVDALQKLATELPALDRNSLRTAQRMNELNQALIQSRMSFNRARVDALLQAAGAATYGAQGQVAPASRWSTATAPVTQA